MNAPLRVLVLWFPDWPLRAVLGTPAPHPPTALLRAGVVTACTASAREHGVRAGQRRRAAQGAFPALALLPHDPVHDERAFHPVLKTLERLSPGVSLLRPGLAALRARGIARYHGGELEAGIALREQLAENGYPEVRIGIADGPFTAELAARSAGPVTVIPPGKAPEFLAPMPLQVLRDEELTSLLIRLGVHTLGEFAALPGHEVRARLGDRGARLHALSGGSDSRALAPVEIDPELAREIEFDEPLGRADQIAFAVRQTADAVTVALGLASLVCTEVRIDLTDADDRVHSRTWLHPTCFDPGDLVDRVRWQLEALAAESTTETPDDAHAFGGILVVRITPTAVDDAAHHQPGLFGSGTDERLHHAVSRVQTMLGHHGVLTAEVSGGRWLADRQQLTPWGERAVLERDPTRPWPGSLPDPLPAEVFRPPRPVSVLTARGTVVQVTERNDLTEPPAQIEGAAVRGWAGPWPLHEHGWEDTGRAGHRLQIVDAEGRAWLVFHSGERWWAEGRYS